MDSLGLTKWMNWNVINILVDLMRLKKHLASQTMYRMSEWHTLPSNTHDLYLKLELVTASPPQWRSFFMVESSLGICLPPPPQSDIGWYLSKQTWARAKHSCLCFVSWQGHRSRSSTGKTGLWSKESWWDVRLTEVSAIGPKSGQNQYWYQSFPSNKIWQSVPGLKCQKLNRRATFFPSAETFDRSL